MKHLPKDSLTSSRNIRVNQLLMEKGARINKDQFVQWGKSHIGLEANEITRIINDLIKAGEISQAAANPAELIIKSRRHI